MFQQGKLAVFQRNNKLHEACQSFGIRGRRYLRQETPRSYIRRRLADRKINAGGNNNSLPLYGSFQGTMWKRPLIGFVAPVRRSLHGAARHDYHVTARIGVQRDSRLPPEEAAGPQPHHRLWRRSVINWPMMCGSTGKQRSCAHAHNLIHRKKNTRTLGPFEEPQAGRFSCVRFSASRWHHTGRMSARSARWVHHTYETP